MKTTPLKISDKIVSMYIYGVIIMLVVYMFFSFVSGIVGLVDMVPTIINEPTGILEDKLLHTIAFSIILVKAYMILVSYAKDKHVSIKYIVEISIIASAVEVIFNADNYELVNLLLLGGFGLINLIIFMIFYKNFEKMSF